MNLGIALNKFRLSQDELKNILENLEDEKINSDEIEKLLELGPTDEEVLKLKEFKGDTNLISSGERYCYVLANINRYQVILEAMKFKKRLEMDKNEILKKLEYLLNE